MRVKNSVIAAENLAESAKFFTEILGLEEVRKFSPPARVNHWIL